MRFTTSQQPRPICRDSVACGERAKAAPQRKRGEEVWIDAHLTTPEVETEIDDVEPDTETDEIEIEVEVDGDDWSDLE